jgi:hypothetical protein
MATAEQLNIEVDFAVADGMAATVQDLCAQMQAHATAPQAGGLEFQSLLSGDGRKFTIHSSAPDEGALQQLLLRIGPDLAQLDAHAHVTRLQCVGAASPLLRKTLSRFNATFA